ncbi:MAG TPA: HNH endonuclease [Candidatus Limnocylindrales bacterium]|nr:HNH endonuclease [Candidatus Limnocylindrales bacterium]
MENTITFFLDGKTAAINLEYKNEKYQALIDADMVRHVAKIRGKWYLLRANATLRRKFGDGDRTAFYVVTQHRENGQVYTIMLHRFVMIASGHSPDEVERHVVDHINGVPSDCRRANLQLTTQKHNIGKQRLYDDSIRPSKSGHRNVYSKNSRWHVKVRRKHFGTFVTIEDAIAKAAEVRAMENSKNGIR